MSRGTEGLGGHRWEPNPCPTGGGEPLTMVNQGRISTAQTLGSTDQQDTMLPAFCCPSLRDCPARVRARGTGRTPAPGCSSNTAQHICRVQRLSLRLRQANFVKKAFLATVTRGRSASASTYNAGVGSSWLTVGKVVSSLRQLTSLPEAPGDRAGLSP